MTTYKKLESLIRKFVPETMELKEGCVIKIDWGYDNVDSTEIATLNDRCLFVNGETKEDGVIEDNFTGDIVEVLGSPIQLSDLLLAIQRARTHIQCRIIYDNKFYLVDSWDKTKFVEYDLAKPFSEQSEELYGFLLNILEECQEK